jgi:hypothetical protein
MKTVLIALFEFRFSDEKELFARDLAKSLDELGVKATIFCDTTMGTELMEELRTFGITVYDMEHKSYTQLLPEYDAIIALDSFGLNSVSKTTTGKVHISKNTYEDAESTARKIVDMMEIKEEKAEDIAPEVPAKPKAKSKSQTRRIAAQK